MAQRIHVVGYGRQSSKVEKHGDGKQEILDLLIQRR
jgi:hypothetical protein